MNTIWHLVESTSLWLFTIALLISFHEYGHFIVARWLGVHVVRFSIGFGRPLMSRFDRHGTEFVVGRIPLGGYVQMLDGRNGALTPEEEKVAFHTQPPLRRMAISAAGPVFNLIFAFAAFWSVGVLGTPDFAPVLDTPDALAAQDGFLAGDHLSAIDGQTVKGWSDAIQLLGEALAERHDVHVEVIPANGPAVTRVLHLSRLDPDATLASAAALTGLRPRTPDVAPVVDHLLADGPAETAGVQDGDRIVSVNGHPVAVWHDLSGLVQTEAARNPRLMVGLERNGRHLDVPITARTETQGNQAGRFVVGLFSATVYDRISRHGPIESVSFAAHQTWDTTVLTLHTLRAMVTGMTQAKDALAGPIGIAQQADQSAHLGLAWFLRFLAALSVGLAVMNLLPIPALDGGYLLFDGIELVMGRPLSARTRQTGQQVGLAAVMGLMGLAVVSDIVRLWSP